MTTIFIDNNPAVNFCHYADESRSANKNIHIGDQEFYKDFIRNNQNSIQYQGYFSGCEFDKGKTYLYRDPNGFSKLYIAKTSYRCFISSRSWIRLVEHGVEFTSIRAVPSGVVIEEENGDFKVVQHLKGVKSNLKIEEIGEELITRIDLFFEQFFRWKESDPHFKDAN